MTWLYFALMTVGCWGIYGILLHKGQVTMLDPVNGRYKAFLFVGIAYFLTAVLAPLVLLMARGAAFSGYTGSGMWWSLVAGIAGAIGAFGVCWPLVPREALRWSCRSFSKVPPL